MRKHRNNRLIFNEKMPTAEPTTSNCADIARIDGELAVLKEQIVSLHQSLAQVTTSRVETGEVEEPKAKSQKCFRWFQVCSCKSREFQRRFSAFTSVPGDLRECHEALEISEVFQEVSEGSCFMFMFMTCRCVHCSLRQIECIIHTDHLMFTCEFNARIR